MCRMLYTMRHGAVVSKRAAARWVEGEAGGLWAPLIERAWEGRSDPRLEAPPEDVSGTLDLIRYTLERVRRDAPPS